MSAPRDPVRESQRRLMAVVSNELGALDIQGLDEEQWFSALCRTRKSLEKWLAPDSSAPEPPPKEDWGGQFRREVGLRLRMARMAAGVAAGDAARRAGLQARTVRKAEAGGRCSIQTVAALGRLYGLSMSWIMGECPRLPILYLEWPEGPLWCERPRRTPGMP